MNKKKRILYLSTAFPKEEESATIYTDLAEALTEQGYKVTVVATEEKRNGSKTELKKERGCRVLRVVTGNHYNVGLIEKGMTYILLEYQLRFAIRKFLGREKYDLILFSAPPVTMTSVVAYAKKIYKAESFLMMKDIFPQNAVDLGMMKKNGLIYKYFRHKEKRMYKVSDYIGCMSEQNRKYLIKHNSGLKNKCVYFPNTKKINYQLERIDRKKIRTEFSLPQDSVIFVFGGNMGKPQGVEFLCKAIKKMKDRKDAFFVLVGRGTEKELIKRKLDGCQNVIILDNMERQKYEHLIRACDVGIVSLNYNFTIPNYPSRILSYMEYAMPVIAATDRNTDFKDLVEEQAQCGVWCASDDITGFIAGVDELLSDPVERNQKGMNGRKYLEKYFQVEKSVELLEKYTKNEK